MSINSHLERFHQAVNTILNSTNIRSTTSFNNQQSEYQLSIVAQWFNSIPHLDIKLHQLQNTTFDPYNNEYLESLGILVALPGFWLILTLLFFLIFFLCRCCDANSKKHSKLTCCKCCLFLFAIISCITILVGGIGNWLSHQGVNKVQNSTEDAAEVFDLLKNSSHSISKSLKSIEDSVDDLNNYLVKSPLVHDRNIEKNISSQLKEIQKNLQFGNQKLKRFNNKFDRLDLDIVPTNIKTFERFRWPGTFGLLGGLIFICIILLLGICRHSRCILILFSVLGLLSLVICWVITSLYLGITVAGSDFCLDPKPFIHKQITNFNLDSGVANFYVECNNGINVSPFEKIIKDCNGHLKAIRESLKVIRDICNHLRKCNSPSIQNPLNTIDHELDSTSKDIELIYALIGCQRIHTDFIDTLSASCKDILEGIALMLISAVSAGLCFTILVLCASHTWINIRKKRPNIKGDENDETDPFLPPASTTSTASSANSKRMMRDPYGSGSSGRPRYLQINCFTFLLFLTFFIVLDSVIHHLKHHTFHLQHRLHHQH